ncbi:MAG: ABC transporter permease [Chloroflexi bacterium]|nr:ABC transporter permease [Chloroflexota bacterium]
MAGSAGRLVASLEPAGRRSWLKVGIRFFQRKPLGAIGAVSMVVVILLAIFAPFAARDDPNYQFRRERLQAPSAAHWFGTDNLGRDVYSRVIYGARVSMYVGVLATAIGTGFGLLLGLGSAYFGGKVDTGLQRVLDIMFAFPSLILAMALVVALGGSLNNVVVAIAVPLIPGTTRLVRSAGLAVKTTQYMDAAVAIGAGPRRLIFTHMLPNCLAPYIVYATAYLGAAILIEASLSFLGLGVRPPAPSWGRDLSGEAIRFFEMAPWMAIFPGIAISMAVFGFNLFGDALRDVLDPKLRGR